MFEHSSVDVFWSVHIDGSTVGSKFKFVRELASLGDWSARDDVAFDEST